MNDASTTNPGVPRGGGHLGAALAALVLLLGVLVVYAPVRGHAFVNFDDDKYVTANAEVQAGLTPESVRWALTATHASNWHPLTWLSHMLDVELFGLESGGHHVTSALLHALAALLLFAALRAMTGRTWASFGAAALFAWHPLRVESVAWVAERKDVLSGACFALALLAYAGYARRGGVLRYLGVVLAVALGLAAKPMLVTLPFVLQLLDVWPLRRRRSVLFLVLEKVPLLALAGASAWWTYRVQEGAGAGGLLGELPLALRLENAVASFGVYLRQLVWPVDLACLYPHAAITSDDPAAALRGPALVGGALLVAGTVAALAARRRGYPLVGWLWTLGMLVPVIGLVQVGRQAHADRYTYLPLIGVSIALAFGLADVARARRGLRPLLATGGAVALALLAWRAREQVDVWSEPFGLWEHALSVTAENNVAHNNLGRLYATEGDMERARDHFAEAVRIAPGTPPDEEAATLHYNLAGAYALLGQTKEAIGALEATIALHEAHPDAHAQLGRLCFQTGRDLRAAEHLRRALELVPGRLDAQSLLAELLATSRRDAVRDGAEAVRLARQACKATDHAQPMLLAVLAAAFAEQGEWPRALRWQERALQGSPPEARQEMLARLQTYRRREPWRKRP